jgi:fucose permease
MLAPLFALAARERAWHVLALVDLVVAMAVTKTRLNRRLPRAGPQGALESAGPAGGDTPAGPLVDLEGSAPARVFGAGAAFLVLAQAAETAVSAWGFTFAVSHFGLPPEVAAMFPTVFYFAFTTTRFFLVPASAGMAPSAMVQVGTLVAFCGALVLLSACSIAGVGTEEASPTLVRWLLLSIAILGAGTCPMYAMVLASVRQHGKLDARRVGLYSMCGNFGNTMGMWVPGLVSLPLAELAWTTSMVVLMASRAEDFPWRRQRPAKLLG